MPTNKRYITVIPDDANYRLAYPSDDMPKNNAIENPGTSNKWSRSDHVHNRMQRFDNYFAFDDITLTFSVTSLNADIESLLIFVGGLLMQPITDYNIDVDSQIIEFTNAVSAGVHSTILYYPVN